MGEWRDNEAILKLIEAFTYQLSFHRLQFLFKCNCLYEYSVFLLNLILGFVLIVDILKYKPLFGYILSIYPIWLSIATTLNLALWILN